VIAVHAAPGVPQIADPLPARSDPGQGRVRRDLAAKTATLPPRTWRCRKACPCACPPSKRWLPSSTKSCVVKTIGCRSGCRCWCCSAAGAAALRCRCCWRQRRCSRQGRARRQGACQEVILIVGLGKPGPQYAQTPAQRRVPGADAFAALRNGAFGASSRSGPVRIRRPYADFELEVAASASG